MILTNQLVIFKTLSYCFEETLSYCFEETLSYCFEETKGFDVRALFASRPVSDLMSWYDNQVI